MLRPWLHLLSTRQSSTFSCGWEALSQLQSLLESTFRGPRWAEPSSKLSPVPSPGAELLQDLGRVTLFLCCCSSLSIIPELFRMKDVSASMEQREDISAPKGIYKDKQLSCFTLQTSPYHGEWFDWAWFVDLARSWSSVPTTKLSTPWEDLVPFCTPTTDKEQPLCSLFLRKSHFPTLGDTIRVPAKTERGKSLLFLQRSSPAASWRKASQACDWVVSFGL